MPAGRKEVRNHRFDARDTGYGSLENEPIAFVVKHLLGLVYKNLWGEDRAKTRIQKCAILPISEVAKVSPAGDHRMHAVWHRLAINNISIIPTTYKINPAYNFSLKTTA